jgi:hypothetical protein
MKDAKGVVKLDTFYCKLTTTMRGKKESERHIAASEHNLQQMRKIDERTS